MVGNAVTCDTLTWPIHNALASCCTTRDTKALLMLDPGRGDVWRTPMQRMYHTAEGVSTSAMTAVTTFCFCRVIGTSFSPVTWQYTKQQGWF